MILPKYKTEAFLVQKALRVLKLLRIFIERVVFWFLSDKALLRALSDRALFESSVISSST